jgi:uncharacterized YigZ family protein
MQTISQPGLAEQTINKSRFASVAVHCATEREVSAFLKSLAAKHPHAHHLAFAYQLMTAEGIVQRLHDAGEPSGTAGRPIMQLIEGQKLINACVAVIRYYGGINLGAGGLARAYGGTARLAIEAARLVPFVEMCEIELILDYAQLDGFTRELGKVNGKLTDKKFEQRVMVVASVPTKEAEALHRRYGGEKFEVDDD